MGSMKKNDLIDYIRERFAVEADFPFRKITYTFFGMKETENGLPL